MHKRAFLAGYLLKYSSQQPIPEELPYAEGSSEGVGLGEGAAALAGAVGVGYLADKGLTAAENKYGVPQYRELKKQLRAAKANPSKLTPELKAYQSSLDANNLELKNNLAGVNSAKDLDAAAKIAKKKALGVRTKNLNARAALAATSWYKPWMGTAARGGAIAAPIALALHHIFKNRGGQKEASISSRVPGMMDGEPGDWGPPPSPDKIGKGPLANIHTEEDFREFLKKNPKWGIGLRKPKATARPRPQHIFDALRNVGAEAGNDFMGGNAFVESPEFRQSKMDLLRSLGIEVKY